MYVATFKAGKKALVVCLIQAGRQEQAQKEYMTRMTAVWAKYDCNPLKSMLPLIAQAPIFIGFFQALRSMATAKVPALCSYMSASLNTLEAFGCAVRLLVDSIIHWVLNV